MSHQPTHAAEHLPPPELQEEQGIRYGMVIAVGVSALILFAGATWFAWGMMNRQERLLQPNGPLALPRQLGQTEIGIVDQVPFDVSHLLEQKRAVELRRLESWGWVDRKQGLIHMPIEQAMDLEVERQGRSGQEATPPANPTVPRQQKSPPVKGAHKGSRK